MRAGETIEVTDRGRAVARLIPVAGEGWDDLVDAGQIVLPEDPALDVASIDPVEIGFAPSAELERLRTDEH